ncbi:MAG: TonB-dependent receptor [Acidobacteria bacterium]|nr:TonB-dependent receptor [Acidobacteriota bacterium]
MGRIAFFTLCAAAWPALLVAQSEAGGAALNGTVTDASGAIVSGAKVTVTNRNTGLARSSETSDGGTYLFSRLPVGSYELLVEAQGFKPLRRAGIGLAVGAVATLDVQLQVGSSTETVTVTAEVPLIETSRSQTSTSVNERAVKDLPINGRNFLDFTLLTPGVVRDPRGGDLSFGGQRGTSNSLLIDGNDSNNTFFGQSTGRTGVRNPYAFSQDSVAEFQVNTNGYAAEIGRAGGGVINVVTKSGTNEFHGSGFWFLRQRFLNANTFINNSRRIARQPYDFDQFGGSLGGPVKRNSLFFFFTYDGQRNKEPIPVFSAAAIPPAGAATFATLSRYLAPYTRGQDNNTYMAKVDWNLSARETMNVRYNGGRFTGVNFENGGNQRAQEATGDSQNNTDNLAATYTRVLSASSLFDLRFTYVRDDAPGQANAASPETNILEGGNRVVSFGRNSFSPRYTNIDRAQFISSLSLNRGRHAFKIGGDMNFDRIKNFFPGNFSGVFQFNSLADFAANRPFSFTQGFAGAGTDGALTRPNLSEYAVFAQDSWRATNSLTLNYGVRYDLLMAAQPRVNNPDQQLAAAGLSTGRMNRDTNNLAGRFGFAYRVANSDRTVLRGGIGTFYARTPSIITGTAHSQNGIQVQGYTLLGSNPAHAALMPRWPNVLAAPPALARTPDIYVFAPDYVQPVTHQWNLNIERQTGRDVSLTLGYLGVRGAHLTRTRDINLAQPEMINATLSTGGQVQFPRFSAPRPFRGFGRISLFESGGDSIYHGAFVQLTKRYSRNLQFMASYTWSHVVDTAPDATSVVVGADDGKQVQNTLQPNLDRGNGDSDVRHRFVLSGVWDINYAKSMQNPAARALLSGYQLSLITSIQSGRWFSERTTADLNNDGNARSDRTPFVGRNTLRGPGFAAVDLRFSRDIALGTERAALKLIFEGFNITNRANFSGFDQTPWAYNATTRVFTPRPQFRTMTGSADPRILQLAARITF